MKRDLWQLDMINIKKVSMTLTIRWEIYNPFVFIEYDNNKMKFARGSHGHFFKVTQDVHIIFE